MNTTFTLPPSEELEQRAKEILEPSVYDYIAGGAGSEWGVTNNNHAFQGYQIIPRVLQKSGNIDTSLNIFDDLIPSPVIIGPCAFHKMVCSNGELATAKACEKANAILTLSTMSTCSIEDVAHASSSIKWFQLYIFKNRDITIELVKRAEISGYRALVVTVDVPAMGMRTRDIRNKFSLPTGIEAANFIKAGLSSLSDKVDGSKVKEHTDKQFDSDLGWDSIDWLRSITKLPIILKGILNAEDAAEALQHGVSAIVVSNHGGRQIDSAISAIDALHDIAKVINNRIPLIVDGGVRCGEDVFKAIALGAKAVMVARPAMWALAVGGESELVTYLKRLQDELALTMRLAGCNNLEVIKERGLSLLSGSGITALRLKEMMNFINERNVGQKIGSPTPARFFTVQ